MYSLMSIYTNYHWPLDCHCGFVCYMQHFVATTQLVLIIRVIKISEKVSVLVLLLLITSIKKLKINFLLNIRFCAALLSYTRIVLWGGSWLANRKMFS